MISVSNTTKNLTLVISKNLNKNIEASSPVLQQKNEEKENNNNTPCPVLYFSGVTNTEMMTTYRIIANEIYQETDGNLYELSLKLYKT